MSKYHQVTALAESPYLIDGLPKRGQLAVFEHLIENFNAKELRKLPETARAKLLRILPAEKGDHKEMGDNRSTLPPFIATQLEAFMEKYKIKELGSSRVAVTIPQTISKVEFLEEAQELSRMLHRADPERYQAKQAVVPTRLRAWWSESKFTEKYVTIDGLRVDGNVKGSSYQSRQEQNSKGWNNVALDDLAVAHVAFYICTGKDLFKGHIVRTERENQMLEFSKFGRGLDFPEGCFNLDVNGFENVSASCHEAFGERWR